MRAEERDGECLVSMPHFYASLPLAHLLTTTTFAFPFGGFTSMLGAALVGCLNEGLVEDGVGGVE